MVATVPTSRPDARVALPGIAPGHPFSRRLRQLAPGIGMLAALMLVAALAIAPFAPRQVVPASATPDVFSAERALPHLQAIAQAPHPVGSADNRRVREYVLEQLSAAGLQPQVQRATVMDPLEGTAAVVSNILVRLNGTANTRAVMFTAHYDSVESGPGTGDNGMAVASMLETLRALRNGPPLRNDLIFLIDDGEEEGKMGALAFVQAHPWAGDVGLVFDFDFDGPVGPSVLGWTTRHDGWLVREIARSNSGLLAVMADNPGKRQEYGNDLHVFARAGYLGAHVDIVGGSTYYHTTRDSLANLELGSLQHEGTAMLALARHFGDLEIGDTHAEDTVALTVFGSPMVQYPVDWTLPLVAVLVVGALGVVGLGILRRRLTVRGLGVAAVALALTGVAAAALAHLAWPLVLAAHPESQVFAERNFYGQAVYVASVYALVISLVLALWPTFSRRMGEYNLAAIGVLATTALALVLVMVEPSIAYIALIPGLFGALALALLVSLPGRAVTRYAVLLLAAVPIAGIGASVLYQVMLEGIEDGPALVVVVLVALLALLTPHVLHVAELGRRWLPLAAGLLGVGLLIVGGVRSGFDSLQPRPVNVAYGLNTSTGAAYWMMPGPPPEPWTGQLLAGGVSRSLDELVGTGGSQTLLSAPAPAVPLAPPQLSVVGRETSGGVSILTLHLASPRQAWRAFLTPMDAGRVLAASVGDNPLVHIGESGLRISGLPAEGIDVTFQVSGDAPMRFTVIDQSIGLPDIAGMPMRPANVMSAPSPDDLRGYPTFVVASYTV